MLDNEDLKWIATSSIELNAMLQQILRYSDLARQHKGEHKYVEMLSQRVELASKTAQSIFDRVTSKILAGTTGQIAAGPEPSRTPSPKVVGTPTAGPPVPQPGESKSAPEAKPSKTAAKSAEAKKPSPSARPAGQNIKNPSGNRELILLVEDEAQVADLAGEMLTEEGYKVILAKDGFEALSIYQQIGKQIGLVILDFFLPVMDGDAVFDELRALNPHINVVLSSGFAEQSKLGNMLAQGLRGFIPKPYTRQKLLEQVRSTLDAAREQIR
jgi:CheY-like chemotaxis protein